MSPPIPLRYSYARRHFPTVKKGGRVTYNHVDRQFKLFLDDLHQHVLRDEAIFVSLATQGHKGVEVLVDVTFVVVGKLLVLVPLDGEEEAVDVETGDTLRVQILLHGNQHLV